MTEALCEINNVLIHEVLNRAHPPPQLLPDAPAHCGLRPSQPCPGLQRWVSQGSFPSQCLVIERAGRRVLLTGGYGLMTCWGSVFTVALCLQVAGPFGREVGGGLGPAHFPFTAPPASRAPSPGCPTWPWPASLPPSSALASALVSWGPGGSLLWAWLKD